MEPISATNMLTPYVGDGYTYEATIPARPGKWSPVEIAFRPITADDEAAIFVRKSGQPFITTTRLYAEAFCGDGSRTQAKLLSWNLTDRTGTRLAITPDVLCGLTPEFFEELKEYITLVKVPMEKN